MITTIDSSCYLFKFYRSDILSSSCGSEIVTDHTVLVVGYGTYTDESEQATDYFILRNSWGMDWGRQGYILVSFEEGQLGDGILGI